MEAEIVEFNERDLQIRDIRRWWRNNPAFSTIDEDCVFEDLLQNYFKKIVGFMGFSYNLGANPKQLVVSAIANGNMEKLLQLIPSTEEGLSDEIIASFLQEISDATPNVTNNATRKKIFMAMDIIFGKKENKK